MECSVTQFGVSEFCETLTGVVDTPGGGILRYLDLLYISATFGSLHLYTHTHIRSHLAQAVWRKSSPVVYCLKALLSLQHGETHPGAQARYSMPQKDCGRWNLQNLAAWSARGHSLHMPRWSTTKWPDHLAEWGSSFRDVVPGFQQTQQAAHHAAIARVFLWSLTEHTSGALEVSLGMWHLLHDRIFGKSIHVRNTQVRLPESCTSGTWWKESIICCREHLSSDCIQGSIQSDALHGRLWWSNVCRQITVASFCAWVWSLWLLHGSVDPIWCRHEARLMRHTKD